MTPQSALRPLIRILAVLTVKITFDLRPSKTSQLSFPVADDQHLDTCKGQVHASIFLWVRNTYNDVITM